MDDQQWIIVNLDKREIYGGGAQLGKLFFSRLPAYLSRDMRTAIECHPPSATPPSDTDLESMDITEASVFLCGPAHRLDDSQAARPLQNDQPHPPPD